MFFHKFNISIVCQIFIFSVNAFCQTPTVSLEKEPTDIKLIDGIRYGKTSEAISSDAYSVGAKIVTKIKSLTGNNLSFPDDLSVIFTPDGSGGVYQKDTNTVAVPSSGADQIEAVAAHEIGHSIFEKNLSKISYKF